MSLDEIVRKYDRPAWREAYLEVVDIVTLLRNCIIGPLFKAPLELTDPIKLTPHGEKVFRSLTHPRREDKVPTRVARLMCLLEIADTDLLVDVEGMDRENLVGGLSKLIVNGDIRYPFIFGGHIYRAAAEQIPDRRFQLNYKETTALIDGLPCGVFQVGRFVTGPKGILRAAEARWVPPTLRVPLQHCSSVTCRHPHTTRLSTSYEAEVNVHLPKIAKEIRDEAAARIWAEFLNLIVEDTESDVGDKDMGSVLSVVGDCLEIRELAQLAEDLEIDADSSISGKPEAWKRAHLLQELWCRPSRDVVKGIDSLVANGIRGETPNIKVPSGEVRRSPLVEIHTGPHELRAELGEYGVRFLASSREFPIRRLRRLVNRLYELGSESERHELAWQLRHVDGQDLADQLDDFLLQSTPYEVVQTLVLARHANLDKALSELHISLSRDLLAGSEQSMDHEVVSLILWKLGFRPDLRPSVSREFWQAHARALDSLREAKASSLLNVSTIRGDFAEVFVQLEGVLADAIDFAWWALTRDHLAAEDQFTYKPSFADDGWSELKSFQNQHKVVPDCSLPERDKRSLGSLGLAFRVLAGQLGQLHNTASAHQRAVDASPEWAKAGDLYEFHFRHTIAFLDLRAESQQEILAGLRSVSGKLDSGSVAEVRNSLAHFRKSAATWEQLERALGACRQMVDELESLGFVRTEFRAGRVSDDEWGRRIVWLSSRDGKEIGLARPAKGGHVGLPPIDAAQYVIRSAVFAHPTEPLRFRVAEDSGFGKMWQGFPLPRRARRRLDENRPETEGEISAASFSVLPEAH